MDKIEFIARFRHACWVSHQMAAQQLYNTKINDDQLEALIHGVKSQLKNPNLTPKESHDNWMNVKRSQGWVYGENKDTVKKTHPNLVAFNRLPLIEKSKDSSSLISHELGLELWEQSVDIKSVKDSELIEELDGRGYIVITVDDVNDIRDTMESWKP